MHDGDDFNRQAFKVDLDANEKVDLNTAPSNGLEYLKRVVMETRQCEDTKVAKFDPKFYSDKVSFSMTTSEKENSPDEFCPGLEWQQEQVADFSDVRQKFYNYRSSLENSRPKFPPKGREKAWQTFCYGDQDQGQLPLLSIVAHFNQPMVHYLLKCHSNWMIAQTFTLDFGRWLYVLLVCLEKPLDSSMCSVLRDIARSCAAIRAELEAPSDQRLGSLNLIICLIARYFDQKDLADNID